MSDRMIKEILQTPVAYECDVVVCGGGTAGFVAALASARAGAKTILVERYGYVGGTLLNGAGPIHSFFNVFKPFPGVEKKQVIQGLPQEIVERMIERGASPGHLEMDKGGDYDSVITLIDWEQYKDLAASMLEEAGVRMLFHCQVAGTVMEGNCVKGIIIQGKSGREAIAAKVVVDTTGDGDVAAYSGADFIKKHETTSVGFPFGMMDVDMARLVEFASKNDMVYQYLEGDKGCDDDHVLRLGFHADRIPQIREFMEKTGMWGPLGFSLHRGNYAYINTCNLKAVDATRTEDLTKAENTLRHQAMEMAGLLKKYVPGFENAYVYWTPSCLGVRYTRAILCEHDMTVDEIVNCARFDDEVMLYGFMDLAPKIMIRDGGYYGIPYRCFIPKKVDGLLVAGRMITTDFAAHMSTRNTGSCMAQGQAVGTAAALSALNGCLPRDLDVKMLREELKRQKVCLE